MVISVIGIRQRMEAKLVSGSEKWCCFERVEKRLVVIGSGGGCAERDVVGELGGGERHYCLRFPAVPASPLVWGLRKREEMNGD